MADLVEEAVLAIRARMSELAPVLAEYERLQVAYAALEGRGVDSADQRSARAAARSRGRWRTTARYDALSAALCARGAG